MADVVTANQEVSPAPGSTAAYEAPLVPTQAATMTAESKPTGPPPSPGAGNGPPEAPAAATGPAPASTASAAAASAPASAPPAEAPPAAAPPAEASPPASAPPAEASAPAAAAPSTAEAKPAATHAHHAKSKPKHHAKKHETESASSKGAGPAAGQMQSWWGGSGKFNVQFVGEGSFGRDLVVLFNSPVKDAAGAHIHVRDAHGNKVSGSWEASPKNDKMLILKKLKYGKYTVSIDADLPDASGDKLGSASKGSIWID